MACNLAGDLRVGGGGGGHAPARCRWQGSDDTVVAQVVTAARRGTDADTFAAVFNAHHRDAVRLAYLLVSDPHQAEDVVAEACAKVDVRWRRGSVRDVGAYLRRAVVNEANSKLWSWVAPTPDGATGDGEVDAGLLVFVDPLAGEAAACPVRELPDVRVSPACDATTPIGGDGILDVAATDGATAPDVRLRSGTGSVAIEVDLDAAGSGLDLPFDVHARPGGRSSVDVAGGLVIGRLQGGPTFVVDPVAGTVAEALDVPDDTVALSPLPG